MNVSNRYVDLSMLLRPLMLVLALTPAVAAADAGWTGYARVLELRATTQGRFVFKLDVDSNPSSCKDKQWFYRDNRGMGANQIYLALLEAVTTGQAVKVYVTGVCDLHGYSEIASVGLAG